ncbi:MAG: hypothetical protein PHH58_00750 [Rhodoferax sp.]|nr:hypothetical protein [Rhodoferax sp.]
METSFNFRISLIVAVLLSFSVAHAAILTRDEYKADKTRISADDKVDKKACDALAGDVKSNCVATATTQFGKN